jgi:hypothetical protein
MQEVFMRTRVPFMMLAAPMLIFAAPGCDSLPTDTDDPAGAQARTELCRRAGSGAYTVSTADPAAATYLEHGDRQGGAIGGCPVAGTARLDVQVNPPDLGWISIAGVVLRVDGQADVELASCKATETCTYTVPAGSTIFVSTAGIHTFTWSDPVCTSTGSSSCVMNGDRSVVVSALPDAY